MKVGVVGSRHYANYTFIAPYLDRIREKFPEMEIVSGGAKGVDTIAKEYAINNSLKYKEFPADWGSFGKGAGPIRNKQIVEYVDFIIAFKYSGSRGTQSTINIAKKMGKKVYEISLKDEI